ncbi:MAG: thioredoxin fold domain-containing protein [Methylophaga sp.]|nr:thioredoxin fold domain-containing protein [Methylophaga sp.]
MLIVAFGNACAEETAKGSDATKPEGSEAAKSLRADLQEAMPDIQLQSLTELGESGLFEAVISDRIYYFTSDGKYLIQGDVLSLENRENLTQKRELGIKSDILSRQNTEDLIIFAPEKTDYMLTVFTDVDCAYCRKLHQEIEEYNELGIGIRYMAFPRAGVESESAKKLVEVWCAKDPQQAMTDAKAERELKDAEVCKDNPVIAHFETGQRLGVEGTPALFLQNGQMLPGYVPPKRLREILDENAKLTN